MTQRWPFSRQKSAAGPNGKKGPSVLADISAAAEVIVEDWGDGMSPPADANRQPNVIASEEALSLRLSQLVESGQAPLAGRLFLRAREQGLVPFNVDSVEWLKASLGDNAVHQIVSSVSGLGCLHCDKGAVSCPTCHTADGLGRTPACQHCVGFARIRCEVCNGTGLAPYESAPLELWPLIIGHRLQMAEPFTADLFYALPPDRPHLAGPERVSLLSDRIQNVDKLIAVFEGAAVAARRYAQTNAVHAQEVAGPLTYALRTLGAGEMRLRDYLRALGFEIRNQLIGVPMDDPVVAQLHAQSERLLELSRTGRFVQTRFARADL